MKPSLLLLWLSVVAMLLAGCHAPTDGDGETTEDGTTDDHDDQDIRLTVRDPPATATVGTPFQMTVDVTAHEPTTSIHSGFHWSTNTTAGRTGLKGSDFNGASPHVTTETAFPGSYTIPAWNMTADMEGTIYLRAHTQADGMDWWGDEFMIEVQAASA